MVQSNDEDKIIDFIDILSDKDVILKSKDNENNWKLWKMYDEKFHNFYVSIQNLSKASDLNKYGIKWLWSYPITSFYELREVLALGPAQVMIGPPLSFDLKQVRAVVGSDVRIRMIANSARPQYLAAGKSQEGIFGPWIRPEDVDAYGQYVDTLEFEGDLKKEETLLYIYKKNKEWPGNLNLLIDNLNFNVDNRAIPEDLVDKRMNCGQRCMRSGSCHLCASAFKLAEQIRLTHSDLNKESSN